MQTLKPHQTKAVKEGIGIFRKHGIVYVTGQVRTGKSRVALKLHADYGTKHLLCITSNSAIKDGSIQKDYKALGLKMKLHIINYESVHLVRSGDFDGIWLDEAHRIGAFPKPGKRCKLIRSKFGGLPAVLTSGTPSPESFSQLFHQLWVTKRGPWANYVSFYQWAHNYVDIEVQMIGFMRTKNNYNKAKPKVMKQFKPYTVTMTQKQAGFDGKIVEHFHTLDTPNEIKFLLNELRKHRLYEGKNFSVVADSASRLSQLYHQISSGTVIDDEDKSRTLNPFKARYIAEKFKGKKIAIYYIYKQEYKLLKKWFPNHTTDPQTFNKSKDLVFLRQKRSGREGVDISTADELIFFNVSYSAVDYWQATARTQSFTGGDKRVHWIFSSHGVEQAVYNAVIDKQDFTLKHFKDYVRKQDSGSAGKVTGGSRLRSNKVTSNGKGRLPRPLGRLR